MGDGGESTIEQGEEPAEETIGGALQTVTRRAVGEKKAGSKGGTQSERVEGGDDRRDGDRQRELTVELPGQSADERSGNENRAQHEGNGDDRPGDFLHRFAGRFERLGAELDVALDV